MAIKAPPSHAAAIVAEAVTLARLRHLGPSPEVLAARDSLLGFTVWTMPSYQASAHHRLIASHLEAVERGEIRRLMVLAPPQHGKSEQTSIRFPAWALCRRPERRIILASYGFELPHMFGRAARNIIGSPEVAVIFPGVAVAQDSKAANLWHTNQGGRLLAVSIGSGVTGFGADIFVIDDPVKSRAEAESLAYRNGAWNWYRAEALTRLSPQGAVVLILTHWHDDDMAGRILAEERGWTVLRLPALAEEGDLLQREAGTALWPERFPLPVLEERRRAIGEREWAALYQQRPSPAEGAIFKYWHRYQKVPTPQQVLLAIDTAYTGSASADYTAWAAWAVAGGKAYLVDADRCQEEIPEAERRLFRSYHELRERFPGVPVRPLVRSTVAIDRVAGRHLRDWKVPVIEVKLPRTVTKEELANIIIPRFEAGLALIPEYANWLEPWLTEHQSYPAGKHDDWVETTLIAMHYLEGRREFKAEPGMRLYR